MGLFDDFLWEVKFKAEEIGDFIQGAASDLIEVAGESLNDDKALKRLNDELARPEIQLTIKIEKDNVESIENNIGDDAVIFEGDWGKYWSDIGVVAPGVEDENDALHWIIKKWGITDEEKIWLIGVYETNKGTIRDKWVPDVRYVFTDKKCYFETFPKTPFIIDNDLIGEYILASPKGKLYGCDGPVQESLWGLGSNFYSIISDMQKAIENTPQSKMGLQRLYDATVSKLNQMLYSVNDESYFDIGGIGAFRGLLTKEEYTQDSFRMYLKFLIFQKFGESYVDAIYEWAMQAIEQSVLNLEDIEGLIVDVLSDEINDFSFTNVKTYIGIMKYKGTGDDQVLNMVKKYKPYFGIVNKIKGRLIKTETDIQKEYTQLDISNMALSVSYEKMIRLATGVNFKYYKSVIDGIKEGQWRQSYVDNDGRGFYYGLNENMLGFLFGNEEIVAKIMEKGMTYGSFGQIGTCFFDYKLNDNKILKKLFEYRFICAIRGEWEYADLLYEKTSEYGMLLYEIDELKKKIGLNEAIDFVGEGIKTVIEYSIDNFNENANRIQRNVNNKIESQRKEAEKWMEKYENQSDRIKEKNREKYEKIKEIYGGSENDTDEIENYEIESDEDEEIRPDLSGALADYGNSKLNGITEKTYELKHELYRLERELKESKNVAREELKRRIDQFNTSSDPFIRSIMTIYNEPERYFEIENDEPLFLEYQGIQFCVSRELYEEEKKICESIATTEANIGNSD